MLAGCSAPFSDLQGAKLVGKGGFELTGSYSSVSASNDGESEKIQDDFGVQAALGLADRVDLRVRYERIELDLDEADLPDCGVNVLGLGPKIGLVEDQVTFFASFGCAFDNVDTDETIQFQPTLLLTETVTRYLEVNSSGKLLIPLSGEGGDNLIAVNVGLGLSSDLDRWALRPEAGLLFDPGEDGHFFHLSLGLTVRVSSR